MLSYQDFRALVNIFSCARKFISVRTEIYRRAHGGKFSSAGKIFCLPTKVRFPTQ